MVWWLSSWLAEEEVRGSISGLVAMISETGYLLLPSRDMAEIPLKRRKSSIQQTNQTNQAKDHLYDCSVSEMRIWSILVFKFYLKLCIHLSRGLFLYFYYLVSVTAAGPQYPRGHT